MKYGDLTCELLHILTFKTQNIYIYIKKRYCFYFQIFLGIVNFLRSCRLVVNRDD